MTAERQVAAGPAESNAPSPMAGGSVWNNYEFRKFLVRGLDEAEELLDQQGVSLTPMEREIVLSDVEDLLVATFGCATTTRCALNEILHLHLHSIMLDARLTQPNPGDFHIMNIRLSRKRMHEVLQSLVSHNHWREVA